MSLKSSHLLMRIRIALGKFLRLFWRPPLPKLKNGEIRLHLGCGKINHPGFINIDAIPRRHVHYVQSVTKLRNFKNNSVDFVYACHVLEHFSHPEVPAVLAEWCRVLRPGGRLCISVPDFDLMLKIYTDNDCNINLIQNALFGGQDYAFNFHKIAFTYPYLSGLLTKQGFSSVYRWEPGCDELHSIDDWSKRPLEINGKPYPISLNVEAVKTTC